MSPQFIGLFLGQFKKVLFELYCEKLDTCSIFSYLVLTFLSFYCFAEDGEDERLSDILESLPVNFGLKDFDRLLPSRFPKLEYRPLLIIAVDSDQEQMAIRLIELGASFHVAGRVSRFIR